MDMLWNGWGDPARATPLPDTVTGLLRELLGVTPAPPPLPLEEIGVPAPPLDADARRALEAAVGQRARDVRTDAESRIRHTRGKSTPTCCGCAPATSPTPRPPSSSRTATTRCSPCWPPARNTAWPSSPSAAAPPSSAASPPAARARSSPSTCAA